jgi:nucleotide-binding universal stress UspA family protein
MSVEENAMIPIQRILLPTDFSEYSAHAVPYACALADEYQAELHVLHVLEMIPTAPYFGMGLTTTGFTEESESHAKQLLDHVLPSDWPAREKAVTMLRHGSPFVETIRYVKEAQIHLMVITTHGRTGLAHTLLGSQAEKLVRKAPCPVLTVRPSGHQFVMV